MTDLDKSFLKLEQLTTKDQKLCVETLLKVFRNVASDPTESKYRTLKLSNKRFNNEVWRHPGARAFMMAAGWVVHEEAVQLPDGVDVSAAIEVLLENRDVRPAESEWVEENKIQGENRTQLREEALRKKAQREKEKEMAQLKKDMDERKAIAQRILHEHRNDRQKRVDRPSVASPTGKGGSAKMADFIAKKGG